MIQPPISAYVLAGGRSSRMGSDKALLQLAGKPLIQHAVAKLHRLTANVRILSSNPALAAYAPLLPDIHPGAGPIGGIEAALLHSTTDWNLILPVDVPFIPTRFLVRWVQSIQSTIRRQGRRIHIAMFSVFGVPQPTLLLAHRNAARYLTDAVRRGEYKLLPALEVAARELAPADAQSDERVPYMLPVDEYMQFDDWTIPPAEVKPWQILTPAQRAAQPLWFSNLNRPGDFAEAAAHADALDT
ncbi:MAG TPA: molybdenum cofactor guanylyltransferase [Acidobacteriaceae bacterium]|nr:molybdenum cofactor guanylyltransferase [Acidobacteriaceae bacterium]